MKNRIRQYYKSTFVRYMLSYILILILLVACLVAYMYWHFHKTVYENARDTQTNKLASVRYQSENHLQTLIGIAERLGLNEHVAPFAPEDAQEKEHLLIQALSPYSEYYDFCDQMYVYFYGENRLYSKDGAIEKERFLSEIEYESLSESEVWSLIATKGEMAVSRSQAVVNHLRDEEERNMITFSVPIGVDKAKAKGNCVFLIPEERFTDAMSDEITDGGNRYMLYKGEIVASKETFLLDESYVSRAVTDEKSEAIYEKLVTGRRYLFIVMPGSFQNVAFFTAIPLTSITRMVANGWSSFVIMLLVFTLPCLGFMILISRNNYKMIREMSAQFSKDEDAYADNIDVIREGIHSLVGKNKDLDSELEKTLPARRSLFVKLLVKGRFESREEAAQEAQQLGLDFNRACYVVFILGTPADTKTDAYLEALLEEETPGIALAGTDLLSYEQMLLVAFSDEKEKLTEFAQTLSKREDVVKYRMPVAVSDVHEDFSEMPTAYLEATSAYDNRFVMGEARLLSFRDVSYNARGVVPQARSYIEAIKQSMSFGDESMMNAQLDELLLFLRNTDMSLFAFRQIYNDVIAAILSIGAAQNDDALQFYDLFTLSNCRSIDELDGILRKVCTSVMRSGREEEQRPLIQNILQYLSQNYTDQSFTLAQLAEKFELTTSRLSVEFKENVHMTPSDYLTMLRMEHSKKLLRQTEMSIKDVCAQVGYSDVSSYIRKFKQYTSATPAQYRQSIRSAQEQADEKQRQAEENT